MADSALKNLKLKVLEANIELNKSGLVFFTFGNVSGIDREREIVAIKPSGVDYSDLTEDNIAVVDLKGKVISQGFNPSSDTKTHLVLYESFPKIGGVAHTHSRFATVFAQSLMDIACFGTTHADYFYGDIPCTEPMTDDYIKGDYEYNTGLHIGDTFNSRKIDPAKMQACLVASHGPFTWGKDPAEAVFISAVLEEVALQNYCTRIVNPGICRMNIELINRHYFRKHGSSAYYGQNKNK